MKKFSWVFITIGIFFVVVALLFLFSFLFWKVHQYNIAMEETSISKFKICATDSSIENADASCGNSFPTGISELYACGYVNADYLKSGYFVNLQIHLSNEKAKLPLYTNRVGDQFTTGNFCRKIIIPDNSQPGLYKVTVHFSRKLVASSQFELK